MQKRTILIITDKNDVSSLEVVSYLHFMEFNVSILTPNSIQDINYITTFKNLYSDVSAIWLRRGNLPIPPMNSALSPEYKTLNRYYHFLLENHPNAIGSLVKEYDHNKLIDLEIAKDCGLDIPFSTIISSKNKLASFFKENFDKEFITKGFFNSIQLKEDDVVRHYGFTMVLNREDSSKIKQEEFFPSFIQEKIEKILEVRAFYIKEEIYSMAIFSQQDEQTSLDYRYYNKEKPNRNVPYKLPDKIEECIVGFMKKINLNSGSLDFILGKDGKYYFLEVNPVGQFGWVSSNCNYYLEKRTAELLINKV